MHLRTIHPGIALTAAALLTLTGCGTTSDGDPAPTAASAGASAPATATGAPATGEPSSDPGTAPAIADSHADPSAMASLSVTDLRIASHDGFDRVVYEFGGTGTPGWAVRYVDQAVQDGSGAAIEIPGRSILEVSLTGTGYPFDTGVEEYSGPNPQDGAGAVTQVRIATVFEGVTQSFIGLSTPPRPVKVSLLSDPVRVVVDVMY
ncbi:AMIN-like domain-containing (lipo)protein [Rhodococcus sp. NPDC003322]